MKKAAAISLYAFGIWTVLLRSARWDPRAQHAGEHIMLDPSELTWKDLPSLPGVKIAIIEGLALDQQGPIMFRLGFPTVLQGAAALAPRSSNTSPLFLEPYTWGSAMCSTLVQNASA